MIDIKLPSAQYEIEYYDAYDYRYSTEWYETLELARIRIKELRAMEAEENSGICEIKLEFVRRIPLSITE